MVSNDALADSNAGELLIGTTIISAPVAVVIVGGGEVVFGVGTLGEMGSGVTIVSASEIVESADLSLVTLEDELLLETAPETLPWADDMVVEVVQSGVEEEGFSLGAGEVDEVLESTVGNFNLEPPPGGGSTWDSGSQFISGLIPWIMKSQFDEENDGT